MTFKFANHTIPEGEMLQFCTQHAEDLGIKIDILPLEAQDSSQSNITSILFEFTVILYILV